MCDMDSPVLCERIITLIKNLNTVTPPSCSDNSPPAESGGRTCPRSSSYGHPCPFQGAAGRQEMTQRSAAAFTLTTNGFVQFQLHLIQFVTGGGGDTGV